MADVAIIFFIIERALDLVKRLPELIYVTNSNLLDIADKVY
jgi:hypothetical protein